MLFSRNLNLYRTMRGSHQNNIYPLMCKVLFVTMPGARFKSSFINASSVLHKLRPMITKHHRARHALALPFTEK